MRRKLKNGLLMTGILLLISEIVLRIYFSLSIDIPIFRSDLLILKYYPELRPYLAGEELRDKSFPRILILGGSAVHTSFCNLDEQINFKENRSNRKKFAVDTIAQYAQNSLDSWYKYKLLSKFHFKYVLFYHGINDTRTNNCPGDMFDENYRHISFYNELFILFRHPEIKITLVPWFLDYLLQKIKELTGLHKTIPKEYNVMEFYFSKTAKEDPLWKYGNEIKSKQTFSRNLNNILELASQKGDSVFVISYASFQPENYSLKKFIDKELGYTEHKWPTELYGSPPNVLAGIEAHNQIGRALAKQFPIARHVEFADSLSKEGKYFFDICHLTPEGCNELGEKILRHLFLH